MSQDSGLADEMRAAHAFLCTPSVDEPGRENPDGSHGWFRHRIVSENAVVGVIQEDDVMARLGNCAKTVVVAAFPDGPSNVPPEKKGKRVVQMPFELHPDGVIRVGGMHAGGSYRLIGAKAGITGDERSAILARRGETVFGDDLDDKLDARPVGKSARLDVPSDRSFSAFFEPHRRRNGEFLRELGWLFSEARKRVEQGTLNEGSGLDGFLFRVAAGPTHLRLRWDNTLSPDRNVALLFVLNEAKRRAQDGDWGIVGFEGLTAGTAGKVVAVDGNTVIIEADGGTLSVEAPVAKLREHIKAMTGILCDDIPVVPIVWDGREVGADTCLFGPITRQPADNDDDLLPKMMDGTEDVVMAKYHRMRQVYAWTTLSCGERYGATPPLYPLELVEPDDLRRTFVQLSGRNNHGEAWDNRLQVNLLSHGAPSVLQARGIGFEIDIFNHSQRTLMINQIKRAKEARAAGGDDKSRQAGKRSRSKRGSKRADTAKASA